MEQPPGYTKGEEKNLFCKLKRSLYGLKQSSRCWNTVCKECMESTNFKQCTADPCIFVRSEGTDVTFISVCYHNHHKTPEMMRRIKDSLVTRFKMKDLGKLHHCLGLLLSMTKKCLWMHQRQCIQSLLERYGLSLAKTSKTPVDINVKLKMMK